jgi:hypothetical protein
MCGMAQVDPIRMLSLRLPQPKGATQAMLDFVFATAEGLFLLAVLVLSPLVFALPGDRRGPRGAPLLQAFSRWKTDTRHPTAVAAFLILLASPSVSRAAGNADLIGTWAWQMPKPACSITRTFSPDGTAKVLNGQKNTTGTYSVKENRARTGRQLIYTVATDDGGTDCDGTTRSTVGTRYLAYLDISGSSMKLCLDSAKSACMGPYRRR